MQTRLLRYSDRFYFVTRYRKKGEEEGEESDFSASDPELDESSITGDNDNNVENV